MRPLAMLYAVADSVRATCRRMASTPVISGEFAWPACATTKSTPSPVGYQRSIADASDTQRRCGLGDNGHPDPRRDEGDER